MLAAAAGDDLGVLQRDAAEGDQQLGRLGDAAPVGHLVGQVVEIADDVRRRHDGRGAAVGIDRAGIAAMQPEEAAQQGGRGMQPAGAAPAIAAAVDGGRPVDVGDPPELAADQAQRLVPRHRDEGFVAVARRRPARPARAPAAPDHRLQDARRVMDRIGQRADERRGVAVAGERPDADQPAVGDDGLDRAPVGRHGQARPFRPATALRHRLIAPIRRSAKTGPRGRAMSRSRPAQPSRTESSAACSASSSRNASATARSGAMKRSSS